MTKAKAKRSGRRLPAFRDDAEERKFWQTRAPGEYIERTRPVRVQVSAKLSERAKVHGRRLRQKQAG